MDEKVIIEDIRNGNRQQLAIIYRTYRSEFITWLSANHACSREEAKEIYQISILTLYENILSEKLSELSSGLKTYLFAIGKNKFQELNRKRQRLESTENSDGLELAEIESWEHLEKEQRLQVMERSLEKLGDPCKTLLELYYFHGLSMDEISKKVGYKNRATAKNLKCKCIVRLRKIFHQESQTLTGV